MYMGVNVLMAIMVLFYVTIGIRLKSGKHYRIISGSRPPQKIQEEGVDIEKLRSFAGDLCFVIAALLLLAGIFDHLHLFTGFVFSVAFLFFAVALAMIRIPRYRRGAVPTGKRKAFGKVLAGISAAFLTVVGATLIYGNMEQSVNVRSGGIEIGGFHGMNVDVDGISDVSIVKTLPKIQAKVSGFDFADVLKGKFRLEGLGDGKLYVNTVSPPFIKIKYNDMFVILNFKDSTRTLATFDKINALRKIE